MRPDGSHQGGKPVAAAGNLKGRSVTVLREAKNLLSEIHTHRNAWTTEQLAHKQIELEDKIAGIKEPLPGLDKVKRAVADSHFAFVFPLTHDVKAFARNIYQATQKMFKTHSLSAFNALSLRQRTEALRYIAKEEG
jgi:hypothetical protein